MTLQSYPSSSDWNPIFFHFYLFLFFILSSIFFPFFSFFHSFFPFSFYFSASDTGTEIPCYSLSAFGEFAIKKVLRCYF